MSSPKKRLSRYDDRPGLALSLWYLWQMVPSTEDIDGDDEAFTEQMWTYYAHQIARESEQPEDTPDLGSSLGPLIVDE